MPEKIIVSIIALLFYTFSIAQKGGIIKGQLIDSAENKTSYIADATISVLNAADSSLSSFTLTDTDGKFELKGVNFGKYILVVSHVNFGEIKKSFSLSADSSVVDMGKLYLIRAGLLDEFVVKSEAPIVVKGDTIQYNTSGFRTQPNATVEDLLKKLPGVEVDREGNIKAQGEGVSKVYLDGKEFFGNDPKMATKNLTADMLESVQVYDDMSDQAKFTQIDDGSRSKTINLKTKRGQNRGYFGRASMAYGSSDRHEGNLSLNKFNEVQRISLVANSNNTNKSNFSVSDIISSMGGMGALRGSGGTTSFSISSPLVIGGSGGMGSNGINRSFSTGLNYTDEWGSRLKMTGSYNLGNSNSLSESESFRRTTFKNLQGRDSVTARTQNNNSNNRNTNHRFNIRLEYQIDSLTSLLYTPSATLQNSNSRSSNNSTTMAILGSEQFLAAERISENSSERKGQNLNNNFLLRRRFNKKGRTLTVGWNNSWNKSESEGYTVSANRIFNNDGSITRDINQNQRNTQQTTSHNNGITTTYTEPFGLNKLLEINYAYTNNQNTSNRNGFNENNGKYEEPNLSLTNRFKNTFLAHRYGANFRVQEKKYNYQLGLGLQHSTMESYNFQALTNKDSVTRQNYVNLFPTANLNFTPTRSKNVRISYNGSTNQPSISQLQTVPDVTDTMNVRIGNPDLKQEFNHRMNMSYNNYNMFNFRFINVNVNVSTTSNKIINNIQNTQPGITLTKPENINGVMRGNAYLTLGFPLRNKWKGSNFSLTNNVSYSKDASMLNFEKNFTSTFSVMQGVGVALNKEAFDINLKTNLTYNRANYEANRSLNENYWTQNYSVDVNYNFPKSFIISTSFDYLINTGRTEGFNQSIPLWNASISKLVFKNKSGEIKLSVNDLLNQNQSIIRYTNENYVEDTRNMVLRRYFLIGFTYNLRKMGAKK